MTHYISEGGEQVPAEIGAHGGVVPHVHVANVDPIHVAVDSMPVGAAALTDDELRASPLPVSGSFYQATQPVSGTFWQSVQPVSGPVTDAQIRATPLPVSGTFWQATQPVSAAALPLPSGAATSAKQDAIISALASLPVTGTFWQATQPVSGPATDAQLRATPLPVSGAFYQATQPVSIAATVAVSAAALPLPSGASTETTLAAIKAKTDNLDVALSTRAVTGLTDTQIRATPLPVSGTVACTGTFFQATQPVSGPATDAQLRATPLPVSGTFYQATQPVSGTFWQATQPISAAALPLPSGAATSAKQDTIITALASVAVTGTFWQATQPVSAAALPLPSGAATSAKQDTGNTSCASIDTKMTACNTGACIIASSALPSGASTSALQTTGNTSLSSIDGKVTACNTGAVVVSSSALPSGAATAALQAIPTLTKGTQGSTGYSTQDLKDAGRVLKTYTVSGLACVTSEALISLTPYADLSAGGGATTFAVTAGKRLRIQKITVTVRATSTVNVGGIVRLRMLAGTVLVGSPVQDSIGCMSSNLATAVIGNAQSFDMIVPDGLELSGTMQFGLTQLFSATTATIDVHVTGYEY